MNQGSGLLEIVLGVAFLLVAFVAIFVALPAIAEYVRTLVP